MAHVLLVEDDDAIRRMIGVTLRRMGHEVIEAVRAREALHVTVPPPDLIITDVNLPDMTGVELAMDLRSSLGLVDTPIVFVTAHPERCNPLVAAGCKGVYVLAKPFALAALNRVIFEALGADERRAPAPAVSGESRWA